MNKIKNLLISLTEFYTELNVLPRIALLSLMALPYFFIGVGLYKLFQVTGFDVNWNMLVILTYSLVPFLLWVASMYGLYRLSNSTRSK